MGHSDVLVQQSSPQEQSSIIKLPGECFSPRTGTSIAWYSIETVWETISQ
nr:MAG TPA: hypothetical protein [Caudoviricetes sp.]